MLPRMPRDRNRTGWSQALIVGLPGASVLNALIARREKRQLALNPRRPVLLEAFSGLKD